MQAITTIDHAGLHAAVVERLLDMLRAKTQNSGDDWSQATTLEDAGVDSFEMVEYIFDIEEEFGVVLDFSANGDSQSLRTVGDLADAISRLLALRLAA